MAALGRLPSVQAATAGLSAPLLDGPPNWAERQSALTHRPNSGPRPTPRETAFQPKSGAAGPPLAWSCCGSSPGMRRTVRRDRPGLAGQSSFKSSTVCATRVRCFVSRLSPAHDQGLLGIASEGVGRVPSGLAPDLEWRHRSALVSGIVVRRRRAYRGGGDSLDIDRPSPGRGHVLLAPGGWSEKVAHFVVGEAEASGAGVGLEAPHRPVAP